MNKSTVIKSILILIPVLLAAYTGFWFFQANQIKENFSELEFDNDMSVKAGDVEVSGFPLAYKTVLKNVTLSSSDTELSDIFSELSIDHIEIESDASASHFSLKTSKPLMIKSKDNDSSVKIEFDPNAIVTFSQNGDHVETFHYKSPGDKIFILMKDQIILSLESKDIDATSSYDDRITSKYSDSGYTIYDQNNNIVMSYDSCTIEGSWSEKDDNISSTISYDVKGIKYGDLSSVYKAFRSRSKARHIPPVPLKGNKDSYASARKNDFALAVSFDITKNKDKMVDMLPPEQMAQLSDNMKPLYRKKAAPQNVKVELNNLNISNSLYSISLQGKMATFADDPIPSGQVTLKIDQFDNFVKVVTDGIDNIKNHRKRSSHIEIEVNEPEEIIAEDKPTLEDKIVNYIKELAMNNPLSTQKNSAFDIRREKGPLLVFINEIPLMKIVSEIQALEKEERQAVDPAFVKPERPKRSELY